MSKQHTFYCDFKRGSQIQHEKHLYLLPQKDWGCWQKYTQHHKTEIDTDFKVKENKPRRRHVPQMREPKWDPEELPMLNAKSTQNISVVQIRRN